MEFSVHPGPRFIYRQPGTTSHQSNLWSTYVAVTRGQMVYAGMRHNSVRGELNSGTAALIDSGAAHHGRHGELLVLSLVWKLETRTGTGTGTGSSHRRVISWRCAGALSRKNLLLAYHEEWPDAETFGPGGDLAGGACRVCAKLVSGERKATSSWAPP